MTQLSTHAECFQRDVLRGLGSEPKTLPCKYFYDEVGCELFERICQTPEYYLTRVELRLMQRFAAEIAHELGSRAAIVEYGSGAGVKIRLLLDHMIDPVAYVPVDIAGDQLQAIAEQLGHDYPDLEVQPIAADFTRPFPSPRFQRRPRCRVVYFPGSTIGNFTPSQVDTLLRGMGDVAGRDGKLLIGVDLVKSPIVINAAYNDEQGVTEAFNKNLLARANRELDADFDLDLFEHEAFFDAEHERVEIFLRSLVQQSARVGGREFHFQAGERIQTEYSYKYRVSNFASRAEQAGWSLTRHWTDENNYFAVLLLERTAEA